MAGRAESWFALWAPESQLGILDWHGPISWWSQPNYINNHKHPKLVKSVCRWCFASAGWNRWGQTGHCSDRMPCYQGSSSPPRHRSTQPNSAPATRKEHPWGILKYPIEVSMKYTRKFGFVLSSKGIHCLHAIRTDFMPPSTPDVPCAHFTKTRHGEGMRKGLYVFTIVFHMCYMLYCALRGWIVPIPSPVTTWQLGHN